PGTTLKVTRRARSVPSPVPPRDRVDPNFSRHHNVAAKRRSLDYLAIHVHPDHRPCEARNDDYSAAPAAFLDQRLDRAPRPAEFPQICPRQHAVRQLEPRHEVRRGSHVVRRSSDSSGRLIGSPNLRTGSQAQTTYTRTRTIRATTEK